MKIKLTQGKFALIDANDFELVSKYKWHYRKSGRTNGKNGYAQNIKKVIESYDKKTRLYKKNISLFMHNLILPTQKGFVIDHINRIGLDNRRENLRLVTFQQNMANFPKKIKTISKFRGVGFLKRKTGFNGKQWQCATSVNGKTVYWGVFKTEKEAAQKSP